MLKHSLRIRPTAASCYRFQPLLLALLLFMTSGAVAAANVDCDGDCWKKQNGRRCPQRADETVKDEFWCEQQLPQQRGLQSGRTLSPTPSPPTSTSGIKPSNPPNVAPTHGNGSVPSKPAAHPTARRPHVTGPSATARRPHATGPSAIARRPHVAVPSAPSPSVAPLPTAAHTGRSPAAPTVARPPATTVSAVPSVSPLPGKLPVTQIPPSPAFSPPPNAGNPTPFALPTTSFKTNPPTVEFHHDSVHNASHAKPTKSQSQSSSTVTSNSGGLSAGGTAGIVLAVMLVLGGAYCLARRRSSGHRRVKGMQREMEMTSWNTNDDDNGLL